MYESRYDRDTLEAINQSINLCDYVSNELDLVHRGNAYYAHCPAHIDRTASLAFSPEKNAYHCFSCGRTGYFINWLVDYEGMNFDEAVQKAAELSKVDLSKACLSPTVKFLKNLKKMKQPKSPKYDHPILDEKIYDKYSTELPQEWIDEGIEPSVMNKFGIRIDTIGNRIVYPVRDVTGKLVNIKGRTRYQNYKELRLQKYINYEKVGVLDYFQGLDITLADVLEKNEAIIFESIKSVMKAYGWGYRNCVSAETHMLTSQQEQLLIHLKCNIVFAYDNDVDYLDKSVRQSIDRLKRITNVYLIKDNNKLLGEKDTKNSPADCGKEVWEQLYSSKKKVI